MNTKLTLKLDKEVIDRAKQYALSHKRSLSGIVEAYLRTLSDADRTRPGNDIEISPFVKSLRSGVKIPANYNYKEAYGDHLADKYK